jgi:signal transduction histidine kinase
MPVNKALALFRKGAFGKWGPDKVFNNGYNNVGSYWFAFNMHNTEPNYHEMYWSIANQVDSAILYTTDTLNHIIATNTVRAFTPADLRVLQVRRIAFRLQLKPDEKQTYLMHVFYCSHKCWYLPMWFDTAANMMQIDLYRQLRLGVYIGIYIFIIIVSTLLLLFFKKKIYLWYALYIFSFLFFVLIDEHLIIEFFDSTYIIKYLYAVSPYPFMIFCLACNLKIMQLLCHQTVNNSRFYKPARLVIYLNICIAALYFLSPWLLSQTGEYRLYANISFSVNIVIPLTLIVLLASVIEQVDKRNMMALYYLLAVICLCFGIINYYFNNLGVTNFLAFKPNGLIVGTTIEILIITLLIGKDYRSLKREKEDLLTEKKLSELSNANSIIKTQEDERTRIAQDLHDDVGATLSTLKLYISQFNQSADMPAEAQLEYYPRALTLITKATDDLRSIAHNLLPQDFKNIGLFTSLQSRIRELNYKNNTQFTLSLEGNESRLDMASTGISVYRIVNELAINILKHAQAASASVQLIIWDNELEIITEDDGIGMDQVVNKKGIGLKNIVSRIAYLKGTINIDTNENGTTVIINIPLA